MIRGLYGRLALVLLSVFLILGIALFQIYENAGQRLQQEISQQLHLKLASYLVQDVDLYDQGELDQDSAQKAFNTVMMLDPATELYVISREGEVLTYEAKDEDDVIINQNIAVEPILHFLNDPKDLPILGDDPRSKRQKVFSAAPIKSDTGELESYLYIILQGKEHDDVSSLKNINDDWLLNLSLLAAALLFLLLTALLLFYKFTRPLVDLKCEVAAFEASGFQTLPDNTVNSQTQGSGDEIQQLHGSFRRMGHRIVEQLQSLRKHDELRREFLAHVSHDLRTPLAGMSAYLETLQLQGNQLSNEEREGFLQKALASNKQLGNMLRQLFELARLEHGQVEIHPDNVMISDLLSDMYAALSGMANDKGIHLDVQMADPELTAHADVARLERVLQNLIANAIAYTPVGGTVTVRVTPELGAVQIRVEDTGAGIPEEDLEHVFEPYFRAGAGRDAHQKGQGLGLAIAVELLALHGVELKVESQLGVGSVFWFRLEAGRSGE